MEALYALRDMLCGELEEYGKKGELSAGTLDIVDKLTHAIKNLDKIIAVEEGADYSSAGGSYGYDGDGYGGMMPRTGGSYARGRMNARRDSRGRYSGRGYSRTGDIADRLREIAEDVPDEKTKQEIHRMISRMGNN